MKWFVKTPKNWEGQSRRILSVRVSNATSSNDYLHVNLHFKHEFYKKALFQCLLADLRPRSLGCWTNRVLHGWLLTHRWWEVFLHFSLPSANKQITDTCKGPTTSFPQESYASFVCLCGLSGRLECPVGSVHLPNGLTFGTVRSVCSTQWTTVCSIHYKPKRCHGNICAQG